MPGWHRRKYWFLSTSASSGEPTIAGLWKALTQSTTTHGIFHVQKAKGAVKKYFWGVLMFLALGALIFNISALSYIYFIYNVNVHIELQHNNELVFPAITICNMSPVRQASLDENPDILEKLSAFSNRRRRKRDVSDDSSSVPNNGSCCCSCYFDLAGDGSANGADIGACNVCKGNPSECQGNAGFSNTSSSFVDGYPEPLEGSMFPERVQTREDFQAMERLTQGLASLTAEERQIIGYQAEDMILDCQYAGSDCYLRDFVPYHSTVQGNCYIFNSGWNSSSLHTSKKSGRRHGLHLTLNIDQDQYMKEVGDTAGIRLVVHPQNRVPFPEDEGISVAPGQATSIRLKQVTIQREKPPYGKCQDIDKDVRWRNAYAELYPVLYSASACYKTCYQRTVVKLCECADPYYPFSTSDGKNIKPCDFNDIIQDDCMYQIGEMFNENNLSCDCLNPCTDMHYEVGLSTGVWPSNVQKEEVLSKLSSKIAYLLTDRSNPDKYKENLVKLIIYYEEFNYQDMEERPAYPPQKYLSDLGGALGLWLGMSMLSIVEFGEFFMDVTVLMVTKLCPGNNKVNASHQDLQEDIKAEMKQYEKPKLKKGASQNASSQKLWVPGPLRAYYFGNWGVDPAEPAEEKKKF